MIKNIFRKIFRKSRKITTDQQKEVIASDSTQKAEEILKEEVAKLEKIKNKLNKNLGDLFNNNVFF